MADINDKFVVYYGVRGYRSGETPTISIYDTAGTAEISAQNMTELGSLGVYYFNFFPKKRTSYTAVMDCTNYPKKAHQIIRIEKTKLAGAIRFPKIKQNFTDKVREEIFSKFSKLSTKQAESNERISDVRSSIGNLIEKSFDKFKDTLKENKKEISLLANNSLEKFSLNRFNTLFTKSVGMNLDNNFSELKEMFLKESNKYTSKELFARLENLSGLLAKMVSLTDESIATANLSNELFSSNFKKRLEFLAQRVDELVILFKNANSKSSDGPSGKEETLPICTPGAH